MTRNLTVIKCADSAKNTSHYDGIFDSNQMCRVSRNTSHYDGIVDSDQKCAESAEILTMTVSLTVIKCADSAETLHTMTGELKVEREIRHGEPLKYMVIIIIINITASRHK